MKYLILLIILSISNSYAATNNCGVFLAKGIIREVKNDYVLIVNEGTQSQYTISFLNENLLKIAPYIEENVILEFEIDKRPEEFNLVTKKIITIENRAPSPLRAKDTYLRAVTKKKCLSSK